MGNRYYGTKTLARHGLTGGRTQCNRLVLGTSRWKRVSPEKRVYDIPRHIGCDNYMFQKVWINQRTVTSQLLQRMSLRKNLGSRK